MGGLRGRRGLNGMREGEGARGSLRSGGMLREVRGLSGRGCKRVVKDKEKGSLSWERNAGRASSRKGGKL